MAEEVTALELGLLGARGNTGVQKRLHNYLVGGRINPAIILAGPEEEDKLTIAKNMAKLLLSKGAQNPSQAWKERLDRRIEGSIHPDVLIYQEPDETTIKVDTIRNLCHQMEVAPLEGTAKVCIVDACHRMGSASANAFLKTLEEPGPDRYFLLLTSQVGSLLPTILSRCIQFHFKPEHAEAWREQKDEMEALFKSYLNTGLIGELKSVTEKKDKCLLFVQYLQAKLRSQIRQNQLLGQSTTSSFFSGLEAFDELVSLERKLRTNSNYGLILENILTEHFMPQPS